MMPEDAPNAPMVVFGIDHKKYRYFPQKSVFKDSGLSQEEIMTRSIRFFFDQNPTWQNLIHIPKNLSFRSCV